LDVTDGSPLLTLRIVLVHLKEGPDYYDHLKKMEEDMDSHWKDPQNHKERVKLDRSLEQAILIISK
jgi:hypothetical protein